MIVARHEMPGNLHSSLWDKGLVSYVDVHGQASDYGGQVASALQGTSIAGRGRIEFFMLQLLLEFVTSKSLVLHAF
jgi:hypothetical protein